MPDGSTDYIPTEKQLQDNPSLVEYMVKEHANDIKSLKNRVTNVESKVISHETMHRLTEQTLATLTNTVEGLKTDVRSDVKKIQEDIQKSNNANHTNQLEHLKQYKTTVWVVGGSVSATVLGGLIMLMLNQ